MSYSCSHAIRFLIVISLSLLSQPFLPKFSLTQFSINSTPVVSAATLTQDEPTTAPTWMLTGDPSDSVGELLGGIGDVNGDGYDDVAVFYFDDFLIYFGSADGLPLTPDLLGAEVAPSDSFYAKMVISAGDVNGDGFADMLMGDSFRDSDTDENVGSARLFYGGETGFAAGQPWQIWGQIVDGQFGDVVASLGDVNSDGYDDIAISAPGSYDGEVPSALFVYYGSEDGLAQIADFVATGSDETSRFGGSVSGAGDINGDGYSDMIVSGGSDEVVYYYFGSDSGFDSEPAGQLLAEPYDYIFAESVRGIGDVNGDGFDDVAVDAEDIDDLVKAYIFYGSQEGLSELPDVRIPLLNEESLDSTMSDVGDINGDGFADLAISLTVPGYEENGSGTVYLYYGSEDGLPLEPSSTIEGVENADEFGQVLANVGDINGDGFSDIFIGAPNSTEGGDYAGKAYLFPGSAGGISGGPSAAPASSSSGPSITIELLAELQISEEGTQFGYQASGVGDVNGDGYIDLLVTALLANEAQGAAYLYLGTADGVEPEPAWSATGENSGEDFGYYAGSAGDLNSDGYADVFVSAPLFEEGKGKLYVYYGSPDGLADEPEWWFTGGDVDASAGSIAAGLGDVNGDGYDDLGLTLQVKNDADEQVNQMVIYHGGESGLTEEPGFVTTQERDIGAYMAPVGDVNGDGFADVLIAPPLDSDVPGSVGVLHGSEDGLVGTVVFFGEGENDGDYYGYDVAGVGDLNGDGYDDMLLSAPGSDEATGTVYLYLGSDQGLSETPIWEATGSENGLWFGVTVASLGDINNDGYADFGIGEAEKSDGPTHANIYLGGPSPSAVDPPEIELFFIHDVELLEPYDWDLRISPAGDLNQDGSSNYLITEPGYPDGSEDGRVTIFRLHSSGPPEEADAPQSVSVDFLWEPSQEQTLPGGTPSEAYGWQTVILADVNGDGFDELAVASIGNPEQDTSGRVVVHYGAEDGLASLPDWAVGIDEWPVMEIEPSEEVDEDASTAVAGFMVGSIGDVNGDGLNDVAMVVVSEFAGQFLGYYGNEEGLPLEPDWIVRPDNDPEVIAGTRLIGLGDINGDGYDDLGTVSASLSDAEKGYFEIYHGSDSGLQSEPDISRSIPVSDDFFMDMAALGDVNDDGFTDLIMGLPLTEVGDVSQINVLLGAEEGLDLNQVWEADSENEGGTLGVRVAGLGDVNGDGTPDFATTELAGSDSSIVVYLNDDDLTQQTVSIDGGLIVGLALHGPGDVNGDGYNDLLSGTADQEEGELIWQLYAGGPDGVSGKPIYSKALAAGDPFYAFFQKLGSGDLNGDGFNDIALSDFNFAAIQAGEPITTSIIVLYGGESTELAISDEQAAGDEAANEDATGDTTDDTGTDSTEQESETDDGSSSGSSLAEAFWESGTELLQQDELELALIQFDLAIDADPDFALGHNGRGRVFLAQENFADAIENFDLAITADPAFWQAYFNRGTARYMLDRYATAVADLSVVAGLEPDIVDTYYWRGFSYLGLDETESAIADFEKLLELEPDHPQRDEVESVLEQLN